MSLLFEAGHPHAHLYPIGYLHDEHAMVVERRNTAMLTEAELLRQTILSIFGKDGQRALFEFRSRLNIEVVPHAISDNAGPPEDEGVTDHGEA